MLQKLLLISAAGALGTLARYGLAGLVQRNSGTFFPCGTLAVNAVGCLIAGLLWTLCEYRLQISGSTRAIFFVGFLGAFTTFSTFILETGGMINDSEYMRAGLNILLQNTLGIIAFFAGVFAGRIF
ncbi:MAG: chromosome condensation protein CrcB [Lentisphaerae bacterium GWF2_45_14]|nr:MAG: chromosome condensation protein CrcB [Lentisphaerae bacterium GWF2_45_14]